MLPNLILFALFGKTNTKAKPKNTTTTHTFTTPNNSFEFQLHRSKRKSLTIIVDTCGKVSVRAPWQTSLTTVRTVLQNKNNWVTQKQQAALPSQPPYLGNENELFPYLGNKYPLKFTQSLPVGFLQENLYAPLPKNPENTHTTFRKLQDWYKQQTLLLARKLIDKHFAQIQKKPTHLATRIYSARFGTCTKKGKITLHTFLIMAPYEVFEYVVVHELCHLQHFNHSRAFWEFVAAVLPDWKNQKDWLKAHGHTLQLNFSKQKS